MLSYLPFQFYLINCFLVFQGFPRLFAGLLLSVGFSEPAFISHRVEAIIKKISPDDRTSSKKIRFYIYLFFFRASLQIDNV